METSKNLKRMIFSSLLTALMIVGSYIRIPVGPVPIVLANMFAVLAGLLLGPVWGSASVGLYLLLGLIGLPVFSGGGGPAYFAGPTGGYLVGYAAAAFAAGAVNRAGDAFRLGGTEQSTGRRIAGRTGGGGQRRGRRAQSTGQQNGRKAARQIITAAAILCGFTVIYAAGFPWLKFILGISWKQAAAAGILPFLPGDAVKAAAAFAIVLGIRKTAPAFLSEDFPPARLARAKRGRSGAGTEGNEKAALKAVRQPAAAGDLSGRTAHEPEKKP